MIIRTKFPWTTIPGLENATHPAKMAATATISAKQIFASVQSDSMATNVSTLQLPPGKSKSYTQTRKRAVNHYLKINIFTVNPYALHAKMGFV